MEGEVTPSTKTSVSSTCSFSPALSEATTRINSWVTQWARVVALAPGSNQLQAGAKEQKISSEKSMAALLGSNLIFRGIRFGTMALALAVYCWWEREDCSNIRGCDPWPGSSFPRLTRLCSLVPILSQKMQWQVSGTKESYKTNLGEVKTRLGDTAWPH